MHSANELSDPCRLLAADAADLRQRGRVGRHDALDGSEVTEPSIRKGGAYAWQALQQEEASTAASEMQKTPDSSFLFVLQKWASDHLDAIVHESSKREALEGHQHPYLIPSERSAVDHQ